MSAIEYDESDTAYQWLMMNAKRLGYSDGIPKRVYELMQRGQISIAGIYEYSEYELEQIPGVGKRTVEFIKGLEGYPADYRAQFDWKEPKRFDKMAFNSEDFGGLF